MRLNNSRMNQTGIGLPVAIFIITIMGLIAAAVNQMGETSSQVYIQNVLSTRAFYAAESGAQLRAQSVLSATPCNCGADLTYTFGAAITGLNSFFSTILILSSIHIISFKNIFLSSDNSLKSFKIAERK